MASSAPPLSKSDLGMLVVTLIWGANFSANKFALVSVPPLAFSAVRFLIASGMLWAIVAVLKPGEAISGRTAWALAGLGLIGNTAYQAALMTGLVVTTATNAALILGAMPVAVAVLGTVFGVERTSPRLWLGIVIATIGVVMVIAARGLDFSSATLRGDLLALLACLCWSVFTVGVRQVGRNLHPMRVVLLTTFGGTPLLVLLAWPDLLRIDWLHLGTPTWLALLYSSVLSIVVAYAIWSVAVQRIGGNRTALYNCIVPIVAALVAWVVLGERPLPIQAVGAALVFAGVFLSQSMARSTARAPSGR